MATRASDFSQAARVTAQSSTTPVGLLVERSGLRSSGCKALGRALRGSTPGATRTKSLTTTFEEVYADPVAVVIDVPVIKRCASLTYPLYVLNMDAVCLGATAADANVLSPLLSAASATLVSPWYNLFSDLDRWATLPSGWDGDDGKAPSRTAMSAAYTFARLLKSRLLPVPEHFIAGDGEISFDWKSGHDRASMSFFDDGSVAGYHQTARGEPLTEFEAKVVDLGALSGFFEALKRFR